MPGEDSVLTLIANRDEYFARPTAPMQRWDNAEIWAGRDLHAGGTWLGVSPSGRLAALTNYRAPDLQRADTPSRGNLVRRFLESDMSAGAFIEHIAPESALYNPFNLLLYDNVHLMGFEGRIQTHRCIALTHGYGSVSNGDFNAPWPKSVWLQNQLASTLAQPAHSEEQLLDLLLDEQKAADRDLPQTGISIDRERALSSAFIQLPDYGTRASSLVRISGQEIQLQERNFGPAGRTHDVAYRLRLRR